MSSLKSSVCNICDKVFQKLEVLNVHMKMVHQESDHSRIERLAQTIGSALTQDSSTQNIIKVQQLYDCSECGIIFKTSEEQNEHNNNNHVTLTEKNINWAPTKTVWSENDTKLYKVATFPNSDGEPFGLTIKGKGKHVDAHNKVMDTMNRLPKDKVTTFGDMKLAVNDKVKTNSLLNAKVTVTTPDNIEGQAEIKIHKPSDKRHKATIEIRKLTGYDYDCVEKLKDLVTKMLDNFTSGDTVSKVLIKAKNTAMQRPMHQW